MNVSEEFYWFTIYEAPADAIHWMSHAEINKYKLLTAPIGEADTLADILFPNFTEKRREVLEE